MIRGPAIRYSVANLGQIADADRRAAVNGDHGVADVVEVRELAGGENEILRVVLREPSDRVDLIRGAEFVRHIHQRQPVREHLLRIDDHGDFARVRPLHLDGAHSRHAAEKRPQNVVRVIAQIRVGDVAAQDEAEDRKDRGRDALDINFRVRRQRRARLADARLHQLKRVLHVGVGLKENRDFGIAANGLRINAPHAGRGADRFLDRARHGEQHGVRREVAGARENHDARKIQLGIDVAGQLKYGHGTGDA